MKNHAPIMFKNNKDMPPCAMSLADMSHNKTGSWRTFKPVLDENKCIKCFICWKFCPENSIDIENDMPKINYDYCKGCGICSNECPKKCIEMVEE